MFSVYIYITITFTYTFSAISSKFYYQTVEIEDRSPSEFQNNEIHPKSMLHTNLRSFAQHPTASTFPKLTRHPSKVPSLSSRARGVARTPALAESARQATARCCADIKARRGRSAQLERTRASAHAHGLPGH